MTSLAVADRVDAGRCAGCNRVVVSAWLCDSCSLGTHELVLHRSDDRRAPTASTISRAYQQRVDRSVMVEQFMALQTNDSDARDFNAKETRGAGGFSRLPAIAGVDRREICGKPSRAARRAIRRRAIRENLLESIMRPIK